MWGVRCRVTGFTLLEMLIALAIVAILVAVSQPTLRAQHTRGVQAQAMATLHSLVSLQERLRVSLGSYQPASVLAARRALPDTVADHYRLAVDVGAGGVDFVIQLIPHDASRTGPILSVDHLGRRSPADLWR